MLDRPELRDRPDQTHFRVTPAVLPPATPAPPSARRRILATAWTWRHHAAALLAVLAATGDFAPPLLFGPRILVDPVIRADFVQTVVASGHVEAPSGSTSAARSPASSPSVPVDRRQTVKAGERWSCSRPRGARSACPGRGRGGASRGAHAPVARADAPFAQEALEAGPGDPARCADGPTTGRPRSPEDGYGTRRRSTMRRRSADVAKAQVRSAEFASVHEPPRRQRLRHGGDAARAGRGQRSPPRQSRLSYTVIAAPRDGVLISRNVERGNVVQPSNVLMKLSPSGDTQLVVQIDEKNLGRLCRRANGARLGRRVPQETFPAEVVYINPGVDLQQCVRGGQAARSQPADLPAPGHEDFRRHRSRAAARARSSCRRPTCMTGRARILGC